MRRASPTIDPSRLEVVPFFPLPRVVFFPNTVLPLHLFEPRYLEMARFCLEEDWPLAVVRIAPGHEDEQPGDPPVEAVAGLGEIVYAGQHSDGRYDIVLSGLARVRLVELPRDTAYRVARAEVLPDSWPPDMGSLTALVERLRGLLEGLRGFAPSVSRMLTGWDALAARPEAVADTVAAAFLTEPDLRQSLLETVDVQQRLTVVGERVADLLVRLSSGGVVT